MYKVNSALKHSSYCKIQGMKLAYYNKSLKGIEHKLQIAKNWDDKIIF